MSSENTSLMSCLASYEANFCTLLDESYFAIALGCSEIFRSINGYWVGRLGNQGLQSHSM